MQRNRKIKTLIFALCGAFLMTSCDYVDEVSNGEEDTSIVEETSKKYTVSYYNYDHTFLFSTQVYEGGTAIYKGATPTKPSSDEYDYTFIGWDKSENNITSNTSLIARFSAEYISSYQVTFYNYNYDTLYQTTVREGETAEYKGITPERPSADKVSYKFIGWNKPLDNVSSDMYVVAMYTEIYEGYVVNFLNYDGSVLDVEYTNYGQGASYIGDTPTRPSEGSISYEFAGWSQDTDYITEDLDVYAQYNIVDTYCNIVFYNYDGSVFYSDYVKYGEGISYPPYIPQKPAKDNHEYIFTGWDQRTDAVFSDLNVWPVFLETARSGSSGLQYSYYGSEYNNEVIVSSYSSGAKDIYIPSKVTYGGKTCDVVGIGQFAFTGNNYIEKVYIDEGIQFIDVAAFSSCRNLKTIYLPETLLTIENEAFAYCSCLDNLVIPSNVYQVGFNFVSPSIKSISVSPSNRFLAIEDNIVYSFDKKTIYYVFSCSDNLIIKDGVEYISENAFSSCSNIRSVYFPSSVRYVGNYAFSGCYNLSRVNFDNSPVSIGNNAFSSCYNMNSLELGNSAISIGDSAFYNCRFTSVEIPSTIVSLSNNAFAQCHYLEKFISNNFNANYPIYNGIIYTKSLSEFYIIPQCFRGTIYIPRNMYSIDSVVLSDYATDVVVDENNTNYYSYESCLYMKGTKMLVFVPREITNLRLKSDTLRISSGVCAYHYNLSTVTFNDGLQVIDSEVFRDCGETKFINAFPSSLRSIGDYAFANCYNLTSFELGNVFELLGNGAFSCSGVSSVNLGSDITTISSYCFSNCSRLKNIKIPSSVKTIGDSCFESCYALLSIEMSDSIKEIPTNCFNCCYSLSSIKLPLYLETISSNAFSNSGLTSVDFPKTLLSIGDFAFYSTQLYSLDLSQTQVANIGSYAFAYSKNLVQLSLPPNLKAINDYLFEGCDALTSISLPSKLESIGQSNFYQINMDVTLAASFKKLKQYAFMGCTIPVLEINSTSMEADAYAFSDCSISKVILGSGSYHFYNYAFYFLRDEIKEMDLSRAKAIFDQYSAAGVSVENLILGSSIVSIGDYAFGTIENVIIPPGLENKVSSEMADTIGNVYFQGSPENYKYAFKCNNVFYYSSTKVEDKEDKNIYWHYNDNGQPELW